MREYVVTCCSTADMSRTFMETNEVPFAMFHYQLDGKEYADDLYSSISPEVFYKMIGDGAQPVTSQVNAEAYCALFEPVLKSGKDVLHLTLSSEFLDPSTRRMLQRPRWKKNIRTAG